MEFSEGAIVTGKVTGIMKFGAFVALPGDKSGLVHISEISNSYVNDVSDCLSVGQEVKVKILSIDANGRVNLSIKKADPAPAPQRDRGHREFAPRKGEHSGAARSEPVFSGVPKKGPAPENFEDKLKAFMKDSENRFSEMKNPPDRKGSRRPRAK